MLGSHNTFSYLPLKNWWMYPFNFMAKCQSKTLGQQIDAGVRYIDIRIKVDKEGRLWLAHGLMTYKEKIGLLMTGLEYFAIKHNVTARVVVEYNHRPKNDGYIINKIIDYVENGLMKSICPHVKFHQIMTKWDEKVVKQYLSSKKDIVLHHKYSSVLGKKRFWTIPYFYAKKHNEEFKKSWSSIMDNNNTVDALMLDFI